MALKRYFLAAAVSVAVLTSCGVAALGAALAKDYSTLGALIPVFVASAAALGVAVAALGRRPQRPSNYPRIDHLRIAGKYHAAGRFGEMGISPLRLRG